jgi:hypothetical protein
VDHEGNLGISLVERLSEFTEHESFGDEERAVIAKLLLTHAKRCGAPQSGAEIMQPNAA